MKISFVQNLVISGGYQSAPLRQDVVFHQRARLRGIEANGFFLRMKDRTICHEGSDDTSVDKPNAGFYQLKFN